MARRGYDEKKELEQHYLRRHVFLSIAPHIGSDEAERFVRKAWPIGDESSQIEREMESNRDRLLAILEREAQKENAKALSQE